MTTSPPAPPLIAEYIDCEPGVLKLHRHQNLLILTWLTAATGASVERVAQAGSSMARRGHHTVSLINWLTPGKPMPEQAVRQRLVQVVRAFEPEVACVSVILNGGGFWAGAARAMINGMRLVGKSQGIDVRIDTSLEAAARWFPAVHSDRTGTPLTAAMLNRIVLSAVGASAPGL